MKYLILTLLLLVNLTVFSQEKETYTFGKLSQKDMDLKVYERDSTANAVFLNEKGKTTFHQTSNAIVISTKYYAKIKIFNKEAFDIYFLTNHLFRNNL